MNNRNKKEMLQRNTLSYVAWHIFSSNAKYAFRNIWVVAGSLLTLLLAVFFSVYELFFNPYNIALTKALSMVAIWGLFLLVLVWLVLAHGHLHRALKQANDFIRAGFVNRAGEPPLLTRKERVEQGVIEFTFFCKGLSLEDWKTWTPKIESALNIIILGYREGSDKRYMIIRGVSGDRKLPDTVILQDLPENMPEDELLVGQGYLGPVSINLKKTPHWLIGGSTGCGKSRLLASLILQMLLKNWSVFLVDSKDVDYSFARPHATIINNTDDLLTLLNELIETMDNRREVLQRAGVHDVSEYNDKYPQYYMRHICVVIDEASAVFDAKGAPKDEKEKIAKVTRYVTHIGRLARFVGIHLVAATQRPDVDSLPGQIKANLSGRIAGHCSDNQASITILDDGTGTELPAIPGRFIIRDGTLDDCIVQAYLLDEEQLDIELCKHLLKNTTEVH